MSRAVIGISKAASGGIIHGFFVKLNVRLSGAIPRVLSESDLGNLSEFSGFVIGGGTNVNPMRYGEKPLKPTDQRSHLKKIFEKFVYPVIGLGFFDGSEISHEYDDPRDQFELAIIKFALSKNKKVLGICRGHQILNVAFGGTLEQALVDNIGDSMQVQTLLPRKAIDLSTSSKLFKLLKTKRFNVNSLHGQYVKRPGEQMLVTSKDDKGIVQSSEHETKDLIGVQWHPEYMFYTASSLRLFSWLCNSPRKKS